MPTHLRIQPCHPYWVGLFLAVLVTAHGQPVLPFAMFHGVSAAPSSLNTNLVAFWGFNETSGSAIDISPGANDLPENATVGYDASGKLGGCRTNVANTAYFTVADNTDLSTGDIAWSIAGWVYMTDLSDTRYIMGKYGGAKNEYFLRYSSSRFSFRLYTEDGGNGSPVANSFGAPSVDTWYFIFCYFDPVAEAAGISINDGAIDTGSTWGGLGCDSDGNFGFGALPGTGIAMRGRMDAWGLWKKKLSATEVTELYNSGAGKEYPF